MLIVACRQPVGWTPARKAPPQKMQGREKRLMRDMMESAQYIPEFEYSCQASMLFQKEKKHGKRKETQLIQCILGLQYVSDFYRPVGRKKDEAQKFT
jgi:hypothetical protein